MDTKDFEAKSQVGVIVRIRPVDSHETPNIELLPAINNNYNLEIKCAKGPKISKIDRFCFSNVLDQHATQANVFCSTTKILNSFINGCNGTIFCYGQTGAGKTYTINGGDQYNTRGLLPRILEYIFQKNTNEKDAKDGFGVEVAYLELYQERLFDLLAEKNDRVDSLKICEVHDGETYVSGSSWVDVSSIHAALDIFFDGNVRRVTASHSMNSSSSRSHAIFTIRLKFGNSVYPQRRSPRLHIIDLAGSESTTKSSSCGTLFSEACCINQSLSVLEQVVIALGQKRRSHIPYRRSKLTQLLKNSLGGNSKTLMIANVLPIASCYDDTIRTLRFASRIKTIISIPVGIEKKPKLPEQLKQYTKNLRQELILHDQLSGRLLLKQFPDACFSERECKQLEQRVDKYLKEGTGQLKFESVREAHKLFDILKERTINKQPKNTVRRDTPFKSGLIMPEGLSLYPQDKDHASVRVGLVSKDYLQHTQVLSNCINKCKLRARYSRNEANKLIIELKNRDTKMQNNKLTDGQTKMQIKALKRMYRIHAKALEDSRVELKYLKTQLALQKG
jgi:kinesin family protein 6/9